MSGEFLPPAPLPGGSVPRRASERPPSPMATSVAQRYRELFGWSVSAAAGEVSLSLGNGMVGVVVPPAVAARALALLRRRGTVGPVVRVKNSKPCWIFLAEPNGLVVSSDDLPPHVVVLGCPSRLPLPATAYGTVEWVVQPDVRDRWLPTLDAVVSAVRDVREGLQTELD